LSMVNYQLSIVNEKKGRAYTFRGSTYAFPEVRMRSRGSTYTFRGSTYAFPGGTYAFPGGTYAFRGSTYTFRGSTCAFRGSTYAFPGGTYAFLPDARAQRDNAVRMGLDAKITRIPRDTKRKQLDYIRGRKKKTVASCGLRGKARDEKKKKEDGVRLL